MSCPCKKAVNIFESASTPYRIGKTGENVYQEIEFNFSKWLSEYPDAKIDLLIRAPKNGFYLLAEGITEPIYIWKPTAFDLANPGRATVMARMSSGEVRAKSDTIPFEIVRSMDYNLDISEPGPTRPSLMDEWIEDIYEAAARYPKIGEEDGYWYVWDVVEGEWKKTDTYAGGTEGKGSIVYVTVDADNHASMSASEIIAAVNYGKFPIMDMLGVYIPYAGTDGQRPIFSITSGVAGNAGIQAVTVLVKEDKTWELEFDNSPTKTSELENNSGFVTAQEAVLYTQQSPTPAQQKQARDNIGAASTSDIPSKTSDLTNDSNYLTPAQIVTEGNTVIDPTLLVDGAAADALSVREAFVANVQPLFVDMLSGNWLGSQNAAFSNSAENAEKYFTFSGAAGADTVSVTGGTASISSLTNNQWWRGVVEYDDGHCVPTMVAYQGTADTLSIFPPLDSAVTSGKIMPMMFSIHATSRGYKWYSQHVYSVNAKHCFKSKPIARYRAWNSDAIPFTKINSFWWGENNGNVQRSLQVCNAMLKHLHMSIDKSASAATPKGFSWTVDVGGKTGYAEILMSGNYAADFFEFPQDEGFVIELYQDGVLTETYHKTTVHYERICLDFSACETIELRVCATGNSVTHTIELTEVSVWETGAFDRTELLPFGSVPAQLFDSWGVQFDGATAAEFKRLHSLKLGVTAPWENHSQGGATSAWGRAWFYENVVKYHPTHVLIDFVINDSNSRGTSRFAQTVAGPDGTKYDNVMDTVDEYIDNMLAIIKMAMACGIQPIVCLAPYGENEKPEWSTRLIDAWSVDPERFYFSVLRGAESPQSLDTYAEKTWVEGKGYQTAQDVQTAIANLQTKAITDTGNYYTTDTVEGALQEIGAELAGVNTLIGSGVIS